MGTNFYHRYNKCECCGRYDERHICKSGTSFQGYRNDPADAVLFPADPPVYDPEILSWADWKTHLQAGGEVWDEYGSRWDVGEFIDYVERSNPPQRRRQYDWMVAHRYDYSVVGGLEHDWLDPEGFSFTDQEFF